MHTEIWVALIGLLGVLTTAFVGYLKSQRERHSRIQAESEMKFQSAALGFAEFMGEWHEISLELEGLMEDTAIDRFLILRAWNGINDPKWTTAVFQFRRGRQEVVSYVHFELDTDYVEKLRAVSSRQMVQWEVAKMEPSAIRSVYEAEGVKHAVWAHLSTDQLEGTDARAITYCSFASHAEEPLNTHDVTRCRIIVGRLKGIAQTFKEHR